MPPGTSALSYLVLYGGGGGQWVVAFLDENHESQTSIQCSHLVTHEYHEDEDIGLIHLFLGLSLYPIRTSLPSGISSQEV